MPTRTPEDKLKYLEERLDELERSTGWWQVEDKGSLAATVRKLSKKSKDAASSEVVAICFSITWVVLLALSAKACH